MPLNLFLLLIIILLPTLLVWRFIDNHKTWNQSWAIVFFSIIVVTLVLSYFTFARYAKSHGEHDYYRNTDYHIIQQEGFKYPKGKHIRLGSNRFQDSTLLVARVGELWMDDSMSIHSQGFGLPLYVQMDNDKEEFSVVNCVEELSMANGDELMAIQNGDTLLRIKYIENSKRKKIDDYTFVFSVRGGEVDSVKESKFRKGFNLADLLQRGTSTRLDADMASLMGDCYLVRNHYVLDAPGSKNTSGKVFLLANDRLVNDTCHIFKNGKRVSTTGYHNVDGIKMDGRQFFFGLPTAKNTVYRVTSDSSDVYVRYRLPIMYHFPNDSNIIGETRMFLTTDIQDIVDHRNDYHSYYQFSEQLTDSNIYKASAVLSYIVDSAGKSINPQYADIIGNQDRPILTDSGGSQSTIDIHVGEQFEVQTASHRLNDGTAQVSYLFRINNMRENNVYHNAIYLYIVMLLLFCIIYAIPRYNLRRNNDSKKVDAPIGTLFVVETSVYLVLIAFLTVRLVLLWRLHTFPPIENVSASEFNRLTAKENFIWTFSLVVAFLVCRIVMLWWLHKGKKWFASLKKLTPSWIQTQIDKITKYFSGNKWWNKECFQWFGWMKRKLYVSRKKLAGALLLPLAVYFALLLLKASTSLWVASKEALIPLVVFAINSYLMVRCIHKLNRTANSSKGTRTLYWIAMIWNTLCYLLFLHLIYNESGMVLPMLAVFALWFVVAAFSATDKKQKGKGWRFFVCTGALALLVLAFIHIPISKNPIGRKVIAAAMPSERTQARIDALIYSPDEMVKNNKARVNDKSMEYILNATSNKWFIDNHLIQRNRIDSNGQDDEFRIDKEYNQNAVSYLTQTRDIALLRYVIYEHGKPLARKLVWILALFALNVFVLFRRKNLGNNNELPYLQYLPLQSSLFLLILSAYLFLVNLNAVVFVGLDFPFLTLTSKVAPLGLLLPLFAVLLPVNLDNQEVCFTHRNNNDEKKKIGVVLAVLVAVILLIAFPSIRQSNVLSKHNTPEPFSVSVQPLAEFVNNYLNPSFRKYQEQHDDLAAMSIYDGNLKTSLNAFFDDEDYGLKKNLQAFKSDTSFIKSAFDKFRETPLVSTHDILHLKKSKGKFKFVVNNVYYDMKPLFDNNKVKGRWRGNLLAAGNRTGLRLMPENTIITISDTLKTIYIEGREGISWKLYQIPAEYCYDSNGRDIFVLCNNSTTNNRIHIDPLGDVTCRLEESTGMRIFPNDVVSVEGASAHRLMAEDNRYLSKRIHYNGKHQVVYPLRGDFMFAYNFDQMLADSYIPIPSDSITQPVQISLDYDLLVDVQNYCSGLAATVPKALGDGITVTAVDGNGRIRLLADYNPHRMVTTDPNQTKEIRSIMDSIYLNGDNELERGLLQNRNLTRMPIGPGSTIKVPFYVALLSEVDIPWENLRIRFHKGCYEKGEFDGDRAVVSYFGPDKVTGVHKLNGWDEIRSEYTNNIDSPLDVPTFIAESNNFYFGSVLMLGTYPKESLQKGLQSVLDRSSANERVFPNFVLGQQYYKFKDDYLREFWVSPLPKALEAGLGNRFGFILNSNVDNMIRHYDRHPVEGVLNTTENSLDPISPTGMNALYVYSTRPSLIRTITHPSTNTNKKMIYDKHFNLTSGGVQEMDVTPLNMAEMYLRIALQRRSNEGLLTYNDTRKGIANAEPLSSISAFQERIRVTFDGMRRVIDSNRGTLSNKVSKYLTDELHQKGIYLYAKTGTAAGTAASEHIKNYHYAFILSNRPLHQNYNRDGLKVYVVYFGFYNGSMGHGYKCDVGGNRQHPRDSILHQIINSETFLEYWKN